MPTLHERARLAARNIVDILQTLVVDRPHLILALEVIANALAHDDIDDDHPRDSA